MTYEAGRKSYLYTDGDSSVFCRFASYRHTVLEKNQPSAARRILYLPSTGLDDHQYQQEEREVGYIVVGVGYHDDPSIERVCIGTAHSIWGRIRTTAIIDEPRRAHKAASRQRPCAPPDTQMKEIT